MNQITLKEVTVTVHGEIGSMEANPDQMEQMLLNLTDNAVKYNRPGGTVDILVEQGVDYGQRYGERHGRGHTERGAAACV